MSDIPSGPGWWQASDGKWYPPEQHPSAQAPPTGTPYGGAVYGGQQPSSYLAWAILSTLFCCLPFGIVAIVKASQVSSLWGSGRYQEAQQTSADAKKWVFIAVGAGVAIYVVYLIIALAAGEQL